MLPDRLLLSIPQDKADKEVMMASPDTTPPGQKNPLGHTEQVGVVIDLPVESVVVSIIRVWPGRQAGRAQRSMACKLSLGHATQHQMRYKPQVESARSSLQDLHKHRSHLRPIDVI